MSHAIVLLSGGIDSATCLAIATRQHDRVTPVHFQYGQQTADVEWRQAENLTQHFIREGSADVDTLTLIDYESVFQHFAGGVAGDRESFVAEDGSLEEEDGRSTGYVPMRNLHLIATGSAVADDLGAREVYIGAQGGDAESYPDCRQEFLAHAKHAVRESVPNGQTIRLRYPLVGCTKERVIRRGDALGVPWEYTYSCYEAVDVDEPEPCGTCPACVERAEAFEAANVVDPFGTPEAVERAEQAAAGDD